MLVGAEGVVWWAAGGLWGGIGVVGGGGVEGVEGRRGLVADAGCSSEVWVEA